MRLWRQEGREGVLRRFVRRAGRQTLDRRLRSLTASVLQRLGGVEAVAELLVHEAKAIRAERPRDPLPLHAAMAIVRLTEYVDASGKMDETPEEDSYSGLSVDEIKARMRLSIIDLIRKEPEIAVAAAEALGWRLIRANSPHSEQYT